MALKTLPTLVFAAGFLAFTPAFAAGGGGGGGGSATSSSPAAPSYDPVVEYQAGLKHLEAGEYKKADRRFAKVLKVTKRHAQTNYYMGVAKVGQDKHKNAVRYFKAAVKADKNMFPAYGGLGAAYANSGKTEKAQSVLGDLSPLAAECGTCGNASAIKAAQDKIQDALDGGTKKAAFLAPFNLESADDRYFASVTLINHGQYQEAFNDLNLTSAAAGPHPDITTYLGYTQRKLGNYEAAKSYYALALDVDPSHKGANEYLGELYVEIGDMGKAKAQLAKLEEICKFGCIEENELRGWITQAQR